MAVALICVVSGDAYVRYAEWLFESARKHVRLPLRCVMLEGRSGWPSATLYRYHAILEEKWDEDYLFLCDADMRFEATVGEEILGELTATLHPGYMARDSGKNSKYSLRPVFNLPFEHRPESQAQVVNGEVYYCGGFVGGRRDTFLLLAEKIAAQIDSDAERGITARWHDESHLNRVLWKVPPAVTLSPSYCMPDDASGYPWLDGLPRKLVALDKTTAERVGR